MLVTARVGNGAMLSGEAIARVADGNRMSQVETRLQAGYAITGRLTGWIGWVHFENYNPHAQDAREDQVVEQLNWAIGNIGRVGISTRTRLEQRFLTGVRQTSWRWRQQVRIAVPLGGRRAPAAILWSEPFVGLNRTAGQQRPLDQLRTFAGFVLPVSRNMDVEIGYLNQRIYRPGATIVNDAVPMSISVRF